ncbi:MAG: large-conductance mechanosensitive channel protein MscL [Caulobacterales bacterium]|nr:large-conductance mechanosensitive channel protein MscL [Caulobacterales bacterium]
MWKEFQEFAMRGNVVDMAVGIIIGGAFGTIVKSLVNDVIMPPIGLLMGGVDFSEIKLVMQAADEAAGTDEVAMGIGLFLNNVISFAIIAWAVFLLVKGMNTLRERMEKQEEEEAEAEPAAPPRQEALLEEIRDLLAKN